MAHFTKTHGFNIYRIPVSWQYLINQKLGGDFHPPVIGKYDEVMQACLRTGSYCIIDIHNYGRWNKGIIGQGGPSNEQFSHLWSLFAKKCGKDDRVVMGIMNEPHNRKLDSFEHHRSSNQFFHATSWNVQLAELHQTSPALTLNFSPQIG